MPSQGTVKEKLRGTKNIIRRMPMIFYIEQNRNAKSQKRFPVPVRSMVIIKTLRLVKGYILRRKFISYMRESYVV